MKKFDCNNVLEYLHEEERICQMNEDCTTCILNSVGCSDGYEVNEESISIVQDWSDSHPIRTKGDRVLNRIKEILPKDNENCIINNDSEYYSIKIKKSWWEEES